MPRDKLAICSAARRARNLPPRTRYKYQRSTPRSVLIVCWSVFYAGDKISTHLPYHLESRATLRIVELRRWIFRKLRG